MSDRLIIRQASTADLPAIDAIIERCVMGWDLPPRVKRLSLESYRYRPEDLAHLDLIVAEVTDGPIAGVAALEPANPRDLPVGQHGLLLHGLYVDPDRQRQGIGQALLAQAMERVRRRHADGLLVKAQADANPFFASQGFSRLPVEDPARDYPHRWWKPLRPGNRP